MNQSLLASPHKSTDKHLTGPAHTLGSYTDLSSLLDTSYQNCTVHNYTVSSLHICEKFSEFDWVR